MYPRRCLLAAALCLLALATGCAAPPAPPSCAHLGGVPMLDYQLFFGRGTVTDQQWTDFAADTVTPNLPDGFTAFDADGQWMNPATSHIAKERTKVIIVAVPDTPASAAAIAAIKDAYRARFRQQAVGAIVHPACAAF